MAGRPLKDLGMIQKHDDEIVTIIPLPDNFTNNADTTTANTATTDAIDTNNRPVTKANKIRPLWRSYLDAKTGATYYHNKVTGETTWEQPSEDAMLLQCLGLEIIPPSDPRYSQQALTR